MPDVQPQTPPLSRADKDRLVAAAQGMLARAYAPYSNFRVGAAVLTAAGNIYAGCNVENASYGLTICAERSAISAAVAAEGAGMRIRGIAVMNSANAACSPCGACRQVMLEFGPQATVIYRGQAGLDEALATQLLPAGFSL